MVCFHADVWLPQAEDVQEFGWLLHLPRKVFQLPFHGQQTVREGVQELLQVREHVTSLFTLKFEVSLISDEQS